VGGEEELVDHFLTAAVAAKGVATNLLGPRSGEQSSFAHNRPNSPVHRCVVLIRKGGSAAARGALRTGASYRIY